LTKAEGRVVDEEGREVVVRTDPGVTGFVDDSTTVDLVVGTRAWVGWP
jgi:hypothetical protein